MNENIGIKANQIEKWKTIARQDADYHRRQFQKPYRSTVRFAEFIKSFVGPLRGDALDVACGAGANIFHLNEFVPGFSWTGVDIVGEELFEIGRPFIASKKLNVNLVSGDFYNLEELFGDRKFDMVLSIQTILNVPISTCEIALNQLLSVTKQWVFITSLFTDFNIDVTVEAMDYTWPPECRSPGPYNIYGLPRFKDTCQAKGCKEFVCRNFDIDIDLPAPSSNGLGTYTRKLGDGTRLQFTGPIFLPWKFIAIRM